LSRGFRARLFEWVHRFTEKWWYAPLIALLSLLDAFVFVIPNEGLLIAAVVGNKKKWVSISLWTTLGSAIGAALFAWIADFWGEAFINVVMPGAIHTQAWTDSAEFLKSHGLVGLALISLSPFPQHLAVAVMGLAHIPALLVFWAVLIGRFPKYIFCGWAGAYCPHWLQKLRLLPRTNVPNQSSEVQ
jgi:membrane protein YqaA with SNARE-associated domain